MFLGRENELYGFDLFLIRKIVSVRELSQRTN